jgi:hypothetical protein
MFCDVQPFGATWFGFDFVMIGVACGFVQLSDIAMIRAACLFGCAES